MAATALQKEIREGISEAKKGNTLLARMHLEEVLKKTREPDVLAWYGYCLACEKKSYGQAITLCKEALDGAPNRSDIYLAVGKIYLLAGRKRAAISAFNRGLKMGRNPAIVKQLQAIGLRKNPVFSSLKRDSSINVYVGIFLSKLGLR
ncbi:MAG TPA: tetratricopeptide repeat protein [Geopsychrobacteraceae bacterium]|nr:tetratricopeptide repeat protein [Geopsychrobacteraceae bacterium]